MTVNPSRRQLNGENDFYLCPRSRRRIRSRETGSADLTRPAPANATCLTVQSIYKYKHKRNAWYSTWHYNLQYLAQYYSTTVLCYGKRSAN